MTYYELSKPSACGTRAKRQRISRLDFDAAVIVEV
jgi:hypothetical protein